MASKTPRCSTQAGHASIAHNWNITISSANGIYTNNEVFTLQSSYNSRTLIRNELQCSINIMKVSM